MMIPLVVLAIEDEEDRAFMTQLYLEYSGIMYRVAYSYVQDHHDAQDIVNDAIVRLIAKIPILREKDSCIIRSYVVSTVKRTSINALRKRNRKMIKTDFLDNEALENIPDDSVEVEAKVIANVTHSEIVAVLGQLPDKEKNLLRWKYFDGYSDEEIADILGIGKASVRAYLTKARRHMHELLERQDGNDEG